MTIDNGIKSCFDSDIDALSRLLLSGGMEAVSRYEPQSRLKYADNAIVPKPLWRKPGPDELLRLIEPTGCCNYNETIPLRKIPDQLIRLVEGIGIKEVSTNAGLKRNLMDRKQEVDHLNQCLLNFIEPFKVDKKDKISFHGFFFNKPGMETVAINKMYKHIGLHIDNSSGWQIDGRSKADNLIFINIGPGASYFLFINKSVASLIEAVTMHKQINLKYYNEAMLVQDFFMLFPGYPVVKLKIEPYEAVVMPVNNIIHDSSTAGITEKNIHLSLIGRFDPLIPISNEPGMAPVPLGQGVL